MGVAQDILDTAGAFDPAEGMLDFDPDARQGAIVSFVTGGQFFAARLFLGW